MVLSIPAKWRDRAPEERVTAFLAWLNETSAYAATYGRLDDGVRLIESIAR